VASGSAWIGTPADIIGQIHAFRARVGSFESASLQVNFNTVAYANAEASVRLFGEAVMPKFAPR